jgi:hypothetical protein
LCQAARAALAALHAAQHQFPIRKTALSEGGSPRPNNGRDTFGNTLTPIACVYIIENTLIILSCIVKRVAYCSLTMQCSFLISFHLCIPREGAKTIRRPHPFAGGMDSPCATNANPDNA